MTKRMMLVVLETAALVCAGLISGNLPSANSQQAEGRAKVATSVTSDSKTNSNVHVLTRGPVHEAFMSQITLDPVSGALVTKQPPEMIDETPPEYRPATADSWIPGYWAWDDVDQDFMWVSGAWRASPPGQRWVPGYWNKQDKGFQWMSGFWLAADARQIAYHQPPPKSVERGANSDPPSENHFWVPGSWEPNGEKYRWRAGYWVPHQSNWTWIPARNVLTANGSLYANGYWDYRLGERGTLFAPVRFQGASQSAAALRFSPSTVIGEQQLLLHLFVRPGRGQYLFGDYYDAKYTDAGIKTWFDYHTGRGGYDPHFAYYSWYYGTTGVNYLERLSGWRNYFVTHEALRPPTTLAAQLSFVANNQGLEQLGQTIMATALTDLVANSGGGATFLRLNADERLMLTNSLTQLRLIGDQRLNLEQPLAGAGKVAGSVSLRTLPLPNVPVLPTARLPSNVLQTLPENPLRLLNEDPVLPSEPLNILPRLPF